MTDQSIIESEMTFGPYPVGHCFYIEKSNTYSKIQDNIKIAEFLLLRIKPDTPPVIWVIEAKKSAPSPENPERFDEYIGEIQAKLTNALSLGLAVFLKRHKSTLEEIPEPFIDLDFSTTEFRLVLVVKIAEKKWLPPLQEALVKFLRTTVRIWALPANAVMIINEDMARKHSLIS